MALAFVHFGIVLKRESVVRVIRNGSFDDAHLLAVANKLANSNFGDDYLIGIESMNGDLSDEFLTLQKLGLQWNDGKDCMDFFIPSDGATTATWLKYERVKHADIHYSVYAHSDDHSNELVSVNGLLNSFSVSSGVLLDRRHWGTVARDELNRLYRPTLVELLNEASCNGRVCPKPRLWNELHEIAVEADINDSTPPSLPLILGGWWESENCEKSERLMDLLHWTCQNNVSDVVWAYLKSLNEDDWHHSDNNVPNVVLSVLEETHNRLWGMGANVSSQTSRAQKLTREWQNSLVTNDPIRYKAEFVADNDSGYKIDLVDLKDRIAYELKVSQNNAHFEFYKDVFKILYANKSKK